MVKTSLAVHTAAPSLFWMLAMIPMYSKSTSLRRASVRDFEASEHAVARAKDVLAVVETANDDTDRPVKSMNLISVTICDEL